LKRVERRLGLRTCGGGLRFANPPYELFGLAVNGRRIRFAENVFYAFSDRRIVEVWSIIDKDAVAAQLA
jgi:predicted ester cyclase